ncbi:four-carbon acid sugar kinase family protein, partial [Bifidobacterium sp. M0353]|nr:four-carbon acid sugar kinase family protein [Bifidobacterium sp. M0353]
MTTQYLIVADDFTGANDTGIQMKKRGINVDVLLSPAFHSSSIVLDTESRNLNANDSYYKVFKMVSEVCALSKFDIIYKKV